MKEFVTGEILVEAEEFSNYGGWSLDSQFAHEMGSPYLLAHGYGRPVEDALTTIDLQLQVDIGCGSVQKIGFRHTIPAASTL